MSQRMLRVSELLKREIGAIVQRDYVFDGYLVTISAVDVTPDLRNGHVFVSVIGPRESARRAIRTLNADHGAIQRKMAKRVRLKFTPQLHFRLDDSVERGVRVLAAIQDVDALPIAPPGEADDDEDFDEDYDDEPEDTRR